MNALIVLGIVALGLAWFAGIWMLAVGLIARLGGWSRLAEAYPDRPAPLVERFRFQTIKLNSANYGSCVTVDVTTVGLRLAVMRLFAFRHRPVLIPWEEMTVRTMKQWGLVPSMEITAAGAPGVRALIGRRLAGKIESVAGEFWREAAERSSASSHNA